MSENTNTETTEDAVTAEVEQLRAALHVQSTKTAYWRNRAQALDDQVLELGIRAGDIRLTEEK